MERGLEISRRATCAAWLLLLFPIVSACSEKQSQDDMPDGGGQAGQAATGAAGTAGSAGTANAGAGGTNAGTGGTSGASGSSGSGGSAGSAGAAGEGGTGGAPSGTSGCGVTEFPADGMQTIDVDGLEREFIVAVPDGYDPNTPYKLIFAWHGQTGTAAQIANLDYYGLQSRSGGTAIFVSAQGLHTDTGIGGTGWDNMNGRDVAFTRAMLDFVRASYCIDDERIFSVGMSYGGIQSNTVGCAMGDVFRAIAPMAGLGPQLPGVGACVGQVATWIAYGDMDELVPQTYIEQGRDYWVGRNNCDSTTQPAGDNGCVAYDNCDEGHPVIWCLFEGGHTVPTFAPDEIWAFFSQF